MALMMASAFKEGFAAPQVVQLVKIAECEHTVGGMQGGHLRSFPPRRCLRQESLTRQQGQSTGHCEPHSMTPAYPQATPWPDAAYQKRNKTDARSGCKYVTHYFSMVQSQCLNDTCRHALSCAGNPCQTPPVGPKVDIPRQWLPQHAIACSILCI